MMHSLVHSLGSVLGGIHRRAQQRHSQNALLTGEPVAGFGHQCHALTLVIVQHRRPAAAGYTATLPAGGSSSSARVVALRPLPQRCVSTGAPEASTRFAGTVVPRFTTCRRASRRWGSDCDIERAGPSHRLRCRSSPRRESEV
ncbi:MAG: hypothetical protein WCR06_01900 [bacterium]